MTISIAPWAAATAARSNGRHLPAGFDPQGKAFWSPLLSWGQGLGIDGAIGQTLGFANPLRATVTTAPVVQPAWPFLTMTSTLMSLPAILPPATNRPAMLPITKLNGTPGVDVARIEAGSQIDASALGHGADLVYLPGAWDQYRKTVFGNSVTFSRTVGSKLEQIVVAAGLAGNNDRLIFSDGAVNSMNAKMELLRSPSVALKAISGHDGLSTSITARIGGAKLDDVLSVNSETLRHSWLVGGGLKVKDVDFAHMKITGLYIPEIFNGNNVFYQQGQPMLAEDAGTTHADGSRSIWLMARGPLSAGIELTLRDTANGLVAQMTQNRVTNFGQSPNDFSSWDLYDAEGTVVIPLLKLTAQIEGTLSDKLGAGLTAQVYDGTTRLGAATIAADGKSWTYRDDRHPTDGSKASYTVHIEANNGTVSSISNAYGVSFDVWRRSDLANLSGSELKALGTQVAFLNDAALVSLSRDQVGQLDASQLAALSPAQALALGLDIGGISSMSRFDFLVSKLSTSLVRDAARGDLVQLDRDGLYQFFEDVSQGLQSRSGALTAAELADLKLVVNHVGGQLSTAGYLYNITNSLVNGDTYNRTWSNHGTGQEAMGNLAAGSSAAHFQKLFATWFLGDNNVQAASTEVDRAPLWGAKGPVANDVHQSTYGDCTVLAAAAGLAAKSPDFLKSLFIDNGDGTYGVTLGGQWYTFDQTFSAQGASASVDNIWVRLLEESWYAWLNEKAGTDRNDYQTLSGSSGVIGGEWSYLKGSSTPFSHFSLGTQVHEWSWGGNTYSNAATIGDDSRRELIEALANGAVIDYYNGTNRLESTGVTFGSHTFAVLGYDASSDLVKLYNPWGHEMNVKLTDLMPASLSGSGFVFSSHPRVGAADALTLSFKNDTGVAGDGITSSSLVQVQGLEANRDWQYSQDGGHTWSKGSGSSFNLLAGSYSVEQVQVRQLNADNIPWQSWSGNDARLVVDTVAMTPAVHVRRDESPVASLGPFRTVEVDNLESGASWQYQIDAGAWQTGSGSSFTGLMGQLCAVRQTDLAGNVSAKAMAVI